MLAIYPLTIEVALVPSTVGAVGNGVVEVVAVCWCLLLLLLLSVGVVAVVAVC